MARIEKKTSYLLARDPSICRKLIPKRKLAPELIEESSETEEENETHHLNVFLRLKPTNQKDNLYEVNMNSLKCNVPMDAQAARNLKPGEQSSRFYTYTKIFPADATQIEIFDDVVKRKVLRFINGENSNLLTYGTSGSGKTFTIVGTKDNPGMIPQSLEYLFRTLPALDSMPTTKPTLNNKEITWLTPEESRIESKKLNTLLANSVMMHDRDAHLKTYKEMQKRLSQESSGVLDDLGSCIDVWISFAEVYNEQVYDLLDSATKATRNKLKVVNNNGDTYINNLKHIYVSNGQDAYLVLQYGLANLTYASTVINPHSSRSHCIFTITLVQSTKHHSDKYHISSINFCDLAGSERSKTTNNVGSRLAEANKINTSLLVLGRYISSIRTCQKNSSNKPISFRDSKLTQILQKALMGKEDISMIVNINQERLMFDETKRALEFSTIASGITLNKHSHHPLAKLFTLDDSDRENYKCRISDLIMKLEEQRMHYQEREYEIRQSLVAGFQDNFYKSKANWENDLQDELSKRDEIINKLDEELDRKNQEMQNSSIISISSTEDDFDLNETVADLSPDTLKSRKKLLERYADLYKIHEKTMLNQITNQKKLDELSEKIAKEMQKHRNTIERMKQDIELQRMEIIRLKENNEKLEDDFYQNITINTSIVDKLEENSLLQDICNWST